MSGWDDYKRQQVRDAERLRPYAVRGLDLDQELQDAKTDIAYRDSSNPRHKEAVKRARRAYDARYGTEGVEDAQ